VQGTGAYTYPVSSSVYDYPGLFRWTYSFTSLVYPVIVVIALLTAIASCLMALLPRWGRPPPALLICSIVMLYATFFHVPLATLPRFSIPFQAVMLVLVVAGAWTGGLQLWSKLRAGEKAS